MPLTLGKDLELSDSAVTQTFGFIARKGAGKTYAAGKLVEGLLDLRAPVVVLDPVGNWYGLRIGADGKSPGYSVPVFGGEHGDVPIDVHQGEAVARLVVQRNLSAVLDVSAFRKNERKRFVTDFAEALFHGAKRVRTARMVVLEEAQVFAPQRAQGEERMLGAIEDIVRLGRNYGLGSTLISQRPQSVNKEVLNQIEALFVGQLSGPHERKAIEQWVVDRGADKAWLRELPSLPVGTMVLWSPQWLQTFQKVQIGKKRTLDASATPELGKARLVTAPVQIDVTELQRALADEAPENPTKSRQRNQRAAAQPEPAGVTPEQAGMLVENRRLSTALEAANRECARLRRALEDMHTDFDRVAMLLGDAQRVVGEPREKPVPTDPRLLEELARPPSPRKSQARAPTAAPATNGALSGPQRAILDTLAALHPLPFTRYQLAKARGVHMRSKGHLNTLGALSSGGYVERAGDSVRLTEKGVVAAGCPLVSAPTRPTRKQLEAFWAARITGTEDKILAHISMADHHREDLARVLEVHPRSKGFLNALGSLRSAGLVTKGATVALTPYMLGSSP